MPLSKNRQIALLVGITVSLVLIFVLILLTAQFVKAQTLPTATLSFAPTAVAVTTLQNFKVGVGLTTSAVIAGTDIIVVFDSSKLDVVSVENGTTQLKTLAPQTNGQFDLQKAINVTNPTQATVEFSLVAFDSLTNTITPGITGTFDPITNPLATITFRPKIAGSTTLSFKFAGSGVTTDSNVVTIINAAPVDILTAPTSTTAITIAQACYDFNGNQQVDVGDLMQIASRWNTKTGDVNFDSTYDLNHDGTIDIVDIQIAAADWGMTCGGAGV